MAGKLEMLQMLDTIEALELSSFLHSSSTTYGAHILCQEGFKSEKQTDLCALQSSRMRRQVR